MGTSTGGARAVGQWMLTQNIGAGSFAVVWKARHAVSGQVVAIKEISTDKLNKKLRQSLETEVSILKQKDRAAPGGHRGESCWRRVVVAPEVWLAGNSSACGLSGLMLRWRTVRTVCALHRRPQSKAPGPALLHLLIGRWSYIGATSNLTLRLSCASVSSSSGAPLHEMCVSVTQSPGVPAGERQNLPGHGVLCWWRLGQVHSQNEAHT